MSPSIKMVTINICNIYNTSETYRVPPMHFVKEEQYVLKMTKIFVQMISVEVALHALLYTITVGSESIRKDINAK